MPGKEYIDIEVSYANPDRQLIVPVSVPLGTTAEEAVELSAIYSQFQEIDSADLVLGIFGKRVKGDRVLGQGERVEIYRPLKADPRDVRRQLAEQGKTMGRSRKEAQ